MLTIFRNDVLRQTLRNVMGYEVKKGNRSYVIAKFMSISKLNTWLATVVC